MITCTVYDEDGKPYRSAEGETVPAAASAACKLVDISHQGLTWDFRRQEASREEWIPPKWERDVDGKLRLAEGGDSE